MTAATMSTSLCLCMKIGVKAGAVHSEMFDNIKDNKMGRVHAKFISTQMMNLFALRDWPLGQFIGKAMYQYLALVVMDKAITLDSELSGPKPAIIWPALIRLSPESVNKALWVELHNNLHYLLGSWYFQYSRKV